MKIKDLASGETHKIHGNSMQKVAYVNDRTARFSYASTEKSGEWQRAHEIDWSKRVYLYDLDTETFWETELA